MMMAFFAFLLSCGSKLPSLLEDIERRGRKMEDLDLKKDAVSYFLMMSKEHSSTTFLPFGLIYDDMHSKIHILILP
jgi:hypothetical protein